MRANLDYVVSVSSLARRNDGIANRRGSSELHVDAPRKARVETNLRD